MFINDALPYYWLALVLVDMLKPGISAEITQEQADINAAAFNPMNMGSANFDQEINNIIPAMDGTNGIGLSGMPNYSFTSAMSGARIVDLDDQNDKFAEVDFREMLVIAKDFARGDTGTMRAPSLSPF